MSRQLLDVKHTQARMTEHPGHAVAAALDLAVAARRDGKRFGVYDEAREELAEVAF